MADEREAEPLSATTTVRVPDLGDFHDVPVIEVLVAPGDRVGAEDPLITLESDKATMDVPAPQGGTVREVLVALGDTVSEGTPILVLESEAGAGQPAPAETAAGGAAPSAGAPGPEALAAPPAPAETTVLANPPPVPQTQLGAVPCAPAGRGSPTAELDTPAPRPPSHASPAVRRLARELGVDLARVVGTGRKGRILKDDVKRFVKEALAAPAPPGAGAAPGGAIPAMPEVDHGRWGPVEEQPLGRIQRISGPHLHRAWLNVPHVTHHDEADITELEAFRRSLAAEAEQRGVRLTLLAFITKALAAALAEHPTLNASLTPDGERLVLKRYFHLGIAVDTPHGLVVPVLRDVDRKGIWEIAAEMGEVSARARAGRLKPEEMQGGCMTISSLGGIGGTAFTPIVNAPEVAILGVTRARMSPVWDGSAFAPRLMLPLDLSYDHRVIDGAAAARFVATLGRLLADVRRMLL